ncbi:MAG: hypothetical protein ACRD9L_11330 [Bryobacteraceae bacterium]
MATNINPRGPIPGIELEARLERLEAHVAEIHANLQIAITAQERLHEQLLAALEELSEALRRRNGPSRTVEHGDPQIQKLEAHLRGIEQRVDRASGQVTSVLESRIWRTLVRGSSILTQFLR